MVVHGAGRGGGRGGGAVAIAVGVAATVGSAQLGLGYGMDIISWAPGAGGLSGEAWIASLTWATWVAATSTIAGAVVADRLGSPQPSRPLYPAGPVSGEPGEPAADTGSDQPAGDRLTGALWRLVLATAAAIGGGVAVALVAIPARVAEVADTSAPQAVAAGYAVLGVVVGLVVAVGALASRAVTANLIATAAWLWLLAVVAVVDGVVAGRDWSRVPLGFWEFTAADPWFRNIFLPDAGLALVAAFVIGALAALPAARRGDHPVGVAVSGAVGPLVLAAAYLLSQPDLVGADAVDLSRHLVAPYLIVAGLLGSLLISAVRPRTRRRVPAEPAEDEMDPAGAAPAIPTARGTAAVEEPVSARS